MISIARILGAPLTVPAGKVAAAGRRRPCPRCSSPTTSLTMCMTWLKRSTAIIDGHSHRAELADPAQIVAAQIDQHDVLGPLFGIVQQLCGQTSVVFGRGPAPAGAGDGMQLSWRPSRRTCISGLAPIRRRLCRREGHPAGRGRTCTGWDWSCAERDRWRKGSALVRRLRRWLSTTWKMSPAAMCSLARRTSRSNSIGLWVEPQPVCCLHQAAGAGRVAAPAWP